MEYSDIYLDKPFNVRTYGRTELAMLYFLPSRY